MRIAYLVGQYPTVSHTFVLREIKELRRLGFDVHVASIRGTDRPLEELSAEELEEQAQTYYVKPAGLVGAIRSHFRAFIARPNRYFQGLVAAVRFGSFDLKRILFNLLYFVEAVMVGEWMEDHSLSHVHIHFSSMVGLILVKIYPVTMSMTIHGPDEFDPNLPTGWCLAEKLKASKFVCVISNYGRSQLMKVCSPKEWDKIEVVPLGVDPSLFSPPPSRESPPPFQLLCVARLAPVKAQRVLIAALDHILQQGRDVQLRLIGDGPERSGLEREVSRRGLAGKVMFEGWMNQHCVRAAYQEVDLFVLPSFAEGVPVVLMEAMATGIPCIATWVAGVPELIRNEIDGLLVAPSSEEDLAAAIMRLMGDPALRRRLGQAGRQHVIDKYNLARNTQQLANIFYERLNNLPSRALTESSTGRASLPSMAAVLDSSAVRHECGLVTSSDPAPPAA